MKNKLRNRSEEIYLEWERRNPKFFNGKDIRKDLYADAVESLMCFFRTKRLSLVNCDIEIGTEPIRWTYLSVYLSTWVGLALNWITQTAQSESLVCNLIFDIMPFIITIAWVIIAIQKEAKLNYLSRRHFLQIVLKRYRELYYDDLNNGNKIVELKDGILVAIPMQAESIYEGSPRSIKYYIHAYLVEVADNGRAFQYVWYSNVMRHSSNETNKGIFIKLCKEQMGKNWGRVDLNKISLQEIQPYNICE